MPYADYQKQLSVNRERQRTPQGAANHVRANREYRHRNRHKLAAHKAQLTEALTFGDNRNGASPA